MQTTPSLNKFIGSAMTPMVLMDGILYHRLGGLWFLFQPSRLSYEKVSTELDNELEAFYQKEGNWD